MKSRRQRQIQLTQIPDGPEHFPDSVVDYCWFEHHDVRLLFARAREREQILQKEVPTDALHTKLRQKMMEHGVPVEALDLYERTIQLREVQAQLCFMAGGNCKSLRAKKVERSAKQISIF